MAVSLLSSSTSAKLDKESKVGKESNLLKIGVDGGTNGRAEFVNEDDNEEGSCLIELLL